MNQYVKSLKDIQDDNDHHLAKTAARYLDGELFSYKFEGDVNAERFLLVTLQGSTAEHRFRVEYTPIPDTTSLVYEALSGVEPPTS